MKTNVLQPWPREQKINQKKKKKCEIIAKVKPNYDQNQTYAFERTKFETSIARRFSVHEISLNGKIEKKTQAIKSATESTTQVMAYKAKGVLLI